MVISCNEEVNEDVRHVAIVILASEVKTYWVPKSHHDHNISEDDRTTLKENILEALFKCAGHKKIYKQYE